MSPTLPAARLAEVGDERFFELSLDLLTVVGFDGQLKRVNPAWEDLTGWSAAELTARPYAEFIHPEDRERTLAEAARLADPGAATRDFELRFTTRDGEWKWLLFSAQGHPEQQVIYAVGKDITDRKVAEGAVQDSEQRFRAVTQSVNDAIISADSDGRIVFWNEAAGEMFGLDADTALGRELVELMPERHREAHLEGLQRMREGGEARVIGRTVELQGLRRDGTEFPLELSLGTWQLGGDRFFTGVIRDLSERHRAARYRAAQHAVADVLVESPALESAMPDLLRAIGQALGWEAGGFWMADPDEDVLRCRAFWTGDPERLAEFEAASRELALSPGSGLPGRVLASGEPAWVLDVTTAENFPRGKAASSADLHGAIGLPVLSEGGQVVAVLDFFTAELGTPDDDLLAMMSTTSTQIGVFLRRKQAEEALARTAAELRRRAEELERSNAELEQFAYVASHDLSEPLRMISGFVQLLSDRYKGRLDDDADDFIGYTIDGVDRMQTLIDDLLAYSRVGRQTEDGDVDLDLVLEGARSALAAAISDSGAEIHAEPLPTVFGDPRELSQLMQNLLSNAIKFVEEGTPRIEISAVPRDGMWEVAVADNGIGIEPRYAERIFKMFQRLHGRDSYPGTGIGLAICKKIVERHGGAIEVEPGQDGGSVFRVTLPAAREGRPE
jgi:PAS domain S-box-containing protein